MKKTIFILLLLVNTHFCSAQFLFKPGDTTEATLPNWIKMMYSVNPNVLQIQKEHDSYIAQHPDFANQHTAYYNQWMRYIQPYVMEDGHVKFPTLQERQQLQKRTTEITTTASSKMPAPWNFTGPEKNIRARYSSTDTVAQISWHANMYCIDQSISNPNVLYAGGENGGVYRTSDKGMNWVYISLNQDMTTVSAIAVNPSDENDVLVNADNQTYHTFDGGVTWSAPNPILNGLSVWQFLYNPANTQMVFACTNNDLRRSLDGGLTWSVVFTGECQSIATMPGDPSVVYALRYDASSKLAYCNKSVDSGATFIVKPTGWFSVPPADTGLIQSYGGRIAVTEANPLRVYVLLVGQSQSTAQLQLNGQIGVYRSDDAGETWSNPHGLIGMPYDPVTHPNMMTFSGDDNAYNQIYYNTALISSQLNADRIIVGGLSMWRSDDAGTTFQPVGGYVGNVGNIHPDNQEFKIYKTSPTSEEMWFACDGGINYSTDFVATHESRTSGIYGAAFWGFDQGWNDDIMVGGRYHNGNAARSDGYPQGEYLQLGGGEAATGYVNYSNEKKTYYSDIDGVELPDTINGIATTFPMNTDPNESYIDNSSSRVLFDWDYWNVSYLGKENKIFKSTNGGSSFSELHAFGTVSTDNILWIEQSRSNTNVMYAQQVSNNISKVWKTTNRGATWSLIVLPQSKRELNFALSATNPNELWVSYPTGNNGSKVYHTTNSGSIWSNITTSTLNGFDIKSMCHQYGTNGGVYLASYHGPVFYRNNTLPDWQVVGSNLPAISYPLRLVPFYRDNKIRLATWHLGIWENQLYEPSVLIADFSANFESFYCPGDTVHFVPHCVASSGATYQWSFPGATPSTSTAMYPDVIYNSTGTFNVQLIVSVNGQADTISKTNFIKTINNGVLPLQENFESGSLPANWKLEGTGTTASNWAINNTAGGFGNSTYSLQYNNWAYDAHAAHDALWTAKYNFINLQQGRLFFDVAYAPYGGIYSDTLEILASTDCGATFTSLYKKGGNDLSTAPANSSTAFIPTNTQWRTDTVDVTPLTGNSEVFFAFVNIGHFGQLLYVDNINLNTAFTGLTEQQNKMEVTVSPNPFSNNLEVQLRRPGMQKIAISILNYLGQTVVSFSETAGGDQFFKSFDLHELANGTYFLELRIDGDRQIKKIVKTN